MTVCNFVTTFQQPGSHISLQQNYSLFYKHTCAEQSIKAAQVIDRILLVEPRARTACARRQMFFSAMASQKWGEQPSVMNYSWLLCTTLLRAEGGMEDAADGRTNR